MTTRGGLMALVSAGPALWLAWTLHAVLWDPLAPGHRTWALDAWLLMTMEFFLVHAGFVSTGVAVLTDRWFRTGVLVALGVFYTLFIGAFWMFSDGSPIVVGAALLLGARLVSAHGGGGTGFDERALLSVAGVVLYLAGVFATAVPETFPRFGFTPEAMAELRPESGDMSGLWFDEPQRVVVFAAGYFLALGLIDVGRALHAIARPRR